MSKDKPKPTRVEGGAPDDIDITSAPDEARPAHKLEPGSPRRGVTFGDMPKEGTDLPGCGVCGGVMSHDVECVGYVSENQITMPAGWCAPSETPRAEDDGPLAGMEVNRAEFRLPLPPEMWSPVPTLEEPLDIDQMSRVEALKAARSVLQTSSGIFGGTSTGSHSVDDLIRIARFITTGQDPRPQQ